MPLRPDAVPDPTGLHVPPSPGEAAPREATHIPHGILYDNNFRFMLDLAEPGLVFSGRPDGDQLTLVAPDGSVAWLERSGERVTVRQAGLRRLWDEIGDLYREFTSADRPQRQRFGITVTATNQTIWLDDPSGPSWRLGPSIAAASDRSGVSEDAV